MNRNRNQPLPGFFTEDQVQILLDLAGLSTRDRAILEVLVATGLRASELLALDAGDVRDDLVHVRHGKGDKARFVPLSARARKAVEPLLDRCADEHSPVFVNAWGDRLSRRGLHRIVAAHLRKAGLKGSLHTLRHTAATRWINHGVGLRSVQAMLGHSDLSTTAVYLGVATDKLVAEVRRCLPEG